MPSRRSAGSLGIGSLRLVCAGEANRSGILVHLGRLDLVSRQSPRRHGAKDLTEIGGKSGIKRLSQARGLFAFHFFNIMRTGGK